MKFNTEWMGVKAGEIYPTSFHIGDECPPELLDAAMSLGVVESQGKEPEAPSEQPARKARKS